MAGRVSWMQWSVCYTWKEVWVSHYCPCTNWPLKEVTLIHVTSLSSLPGWAGEIHQRTGWPPNQLEQVGGPWVWRGGASLWQAHAGTQWQGLSLRLPSHGHRVTSLVAKAVHACWSYLHLFYNVCQSCTYILHLYHPFKWSNLVSNQAKRNGVILSPRGHSAMSRHSNSAAVGKSWHSLRCAIF